MSIDALREALLDQGGTLADSVMSPRSHGAVRTLATTPGPGDGAPQLAASGPRATGREHEYALLLEMILEGSLLHYGAPRLIRSDDSDLALLLGDQLYAVGLARLAELGDLDAVAELADLISLLAQAQAASDPRLADAIWQAGAAAIGWGQTVEHAAAKALARAGDSGAVDALNASRDAAVGRGLPARGGGAS